VPFRHFLAELDGNASSERVRQAKPADGFGIPADITATEKPNAQWAPSLFLQVFISGGLKSFVLELLIPGELS
jgi:hypothetical protein